LCNLACFIILGIPINITTGINCIKCITGCEKTIPQQETGKDSKNHLPQTQAPEEMTGLFIMWITFKNGKI
jgi:hypothetical protein